MARNLDLTALRAFVTVAETRSVTRSAGQLNLTQSAVSMQLKRLEEALDQTLFDRSGRGMALTAQGEQLLGYGRRILALNDEAWGRLTHPAFEGEIDFGVPHDIIYPHVPGILKGFAAQYPRVKVQLHSLYTSVLKEKLARGEMDLILTTEAILDPGGETLTREPLVWAGARGGQAARSRPLRYGTCSHCYFKRSVLEALERAGIPWEMAVESVSSSAVEASVAADLAVSVHLRGAVPDRCEEVAAGSGLPELPDYRVNMYLGGTPRAILAERMAEEVRKSYGVPGARVAAE